MSAAPVSATPAPTPRSSHQRRLRRASAKSPKANIANAKPETASDLLARHHHAAAGSVVKPKFRSWTQPNQKSAGAQIAALSRK